MPFTALPADRPRAEAGIAAAYRAAGLTEPAHVLWVPSPLTGALLTALLDPGLAAEARTALLALLGPGTCVLRPTGAPERVLTPQEAAALLPSLEAGAPVREQVRSAPWERQRQEVAAELGARGYAEAWARTGGPRWDPVQGLVQRIRAAIGERAGEEHGPLVRRATLDAVLGQHDAPWLSLFAELGRLGPLAGVAEVAASAGWWWPRARLVIVAERPVELHRDEPGRLHNGEGPALAYPDGFGLHAWRGMAVEPGFVASLATLTAARILHEENAELRRVMLEHFGYDRYLAETGAAPVHKDKTGTLWRIDLPFDEPVVMVEVLNSTPEPDGTHRTYYLRVPPRTRTAREGVAWTFGLTAEEYHPQKET
ncbi:hypothetical protein LO762_22055 [Actinocorallia sp. API 0066]|uniref:DUF6745 domain-containing protein n=1 Tax=Actinocorallia sp. API 0066 TaxID=2896846 RepID=UPI001E336B10|nr:hypothetical protein [Actinocorallia sp. API 0066]MCD0451859.1 hypothetical protein [Actinocorallia sp. API 0066]